MKEDHAEKHRVITPDLYQHSSWNISVVCSHSATPYPIETLTGNDSSTPHRKDYYFILMMLREQSKHVVDLNEITVKAGELLFASTVPPSPTRTIARKPAGHEVL